MKAKYIVPETDLIFPIIVFVGKKFHIKNDFILQKEGVGWYKKNKPIIIDSRGKVFKVISAEVNSSILWWKFFTTLDNSLVKVKPEIEDEIGYMSVEELKEKIIDSINTHPRQGWTGVDTSIKVIIEKVKRFQTYKDLINYFSFFNVSPSNIWR